MLITRTLEIIFPLSKYFFTIFLIKLHEGFLLMSADANFMAKIIAIKFQNAVIFSFSKYNC